MTELSIGDILSSILSGYDAPAESAPPISDIEAQYCAASWLSFQIAGIADVTPDEAYDCLTHVPDNMLTLLHSPQGMTALASFIAADRGLPEPAFYPTLQ